MSKLYRRDYVKVIHCSIFVEATNEREADQLIMAELTGAYPFTPQINPAYRPVVITEPKAITGEIEISRDCAETDREKERLKSLEIDSVSSKTEVSFRDGFPYLYQYRSREGNHEY